MAPFSKPVLRFFFLWMVVGVVVFLGLIKMTAADRALNPVSGDLLIQLLAFLPLIWFLLSHFFGKLNLLYFFNTGPGEKTWKKLMLFWIVIFLFTTGVEGLQLLLINWLVPESSSAWMEGPVLLRDQNVVINMVNIILVVLIAPLMEEFVFRGLILQRFMRKTSAPQALILSSILFGILHFEFLLSATLFGIFMGLVFLKTRNLWVPVILHVANNGCIVLLNVLQYHDGTWTVDQVQSLWPLYLSSILLIPGLVYFTRDFWPDAKTSLPYAYNQNNG